MAFENVNFDFIKDQEGFETSGYVPKDREGNILGQSGVTIASGFDLGQRNINDLKGLPEELIAKLSDYVGLKGEAADNAAKKLNITKEEGEIINQFAKQKALNKLASDWEAKTGQDFNLLPENKATAIASVAFQYGDLEKKTPNFWNQVTSNDWEGAKKNLANFGDKYGERRNRELDYLNKEEKQTTNPFDYFKALQAAEQEEQMINPALFGQRREEERAKGLEQLIDQKLRDSGNTPMMNTEYNQMPMQPQAEGLAALGRGGDSMMVHMQPEEVAGLQQLAMANGSSLTRNPMTGQMEAFNLGGIFKAAIPMAIGAMVPGGQAAMFGSMTPILAGAAAGGIMAKMSGDDPLMGAISGGMGGYSGAGFAKGLTDFGATTAAKNAELAAQAGNMGQQAAQMGQYAASGASQGMAQTLADPTSGLLAGSGGYSAGMNLGGMQAGNPANITNTMQQGAFGSMPKIDQISAGAQAAMNNPTDFLSSYGGGSALKGGMNLASNVGQLAASGIEESDLYPTMSGIKDPRDTYDPTRRLDLSMDTGIDEALKRDTGLRLLAEGGYLNGEGDGMSDGIGALIEEEQPAALSDGEFIIPADVVSHIGNGSSEAGASKLYNMMDKIRQARTNTKEQAPEINAERYMPV